MIRPIDNKFFVEFRKLASPQYFEIHRQLLDRVDRENEAFVLRRLTF